MRTLGLDFGRVRIGIAVSDPTGMIAQALEVIPSRGFAPVRRRIEQLITEYDVDRIVVGLPLALDGSEREAAATVRAFVAKLRSAVSVPVELADERLSTAQAERIMIEADESRARRRRARDAVAAALILQTHLDRERGKGRRSRDDGNDNGSLTSGF